MLRWSLFLGALIMSGIACSLDGADAKHPLPDALLDPDHGVTETTPRRAVFAGGCFWCIEGVFEELAGVIDARSGYAGGAAETADYQKVSGGGTGHAEVVEVTYDPTRITLGALLKVFFSLHDPTQLNRQGADVGTQYRSAFFYHNEEQKQAAEAYIAQLRAAGIYQKPIVTTLEELTAFHPAEDYHQDYVRHNPFQPYVRAVALPKVTKARQLFADQLKKE